jgi:hypothetical protein
MRPPTEAAPCHVSGGKQKRAPKRMATYNPTQIAPHTASTCIVISCHCSVICRLRPRHSNHVRSQKGPSPKSKGTIR